jgi:hypothetical protein
VLLEVSFELAREILEEDRPTCPAPGHVDEDTRAALAYRISPEHVEVVGMVRVARSYPSSAVVLAGGDEIEGTIAVPHWHDPGHQGLWVLSDRVALPSAKAAVRRARRVTWLASADSDLAEARASGVTAQTVWEYLRLQRPLDSVYARAPEWSRGWIDELASELQASVDMTLNEVLQAWEEDPDGQVPGPYREHVADLANESHPRMVQRVWATYRPGPELPQRS